MPTLVLIRHGQSAWNLENRFTGWWDVDVTEKGAEEARAAGRLMRERGLDFDTCFTSVQTRAIKTLHLALEEMGRLWLPVEKDWRLNERHYGGLTGLDKAETAAKHGAEQVHIWRRSFDIPPPPLEPGSPFDLSGDRRYAGVDVPATESLKDTIARVLPYWDSRIAPELRMDLSPEWIVAQYRARYPDWSVERIFYAATTAGLNCLPDFATTSCTASWSDRAGR